MSLPVVPIARIFWRAMFRARRFLFACVVLLEMTADELNAGAS